MVNCFYRFNKRNNQVSTKMKGITNAEKLDNLNKSNFELTSSIDF